jgi:hypothetical protein
MLPVLFCFSYFLHRLSFCLGLALDHSPPTYTCFVVVITSMGCLVWLICWDGGEFNFLPGLTSNCDPSA